MPPLPTPPPQVVVAALEALLESVKLCAHAFDAHMERIMPCLFMRLQDQKDAVRNLSFDVLQGGRGGRCVERAVGGLG